MTQPEGVLQGKMIEAHAGLFVTQSKVNFRRFCQPLAIKTHKMAPKTFLSPKKIPWDTPHRALHGGRLCTRRSSQYTASQDFLAKSTALDSQCLKSIGCHSGTGPGNLVPRIRQLPLRSKLVARSAVVIGRGTRVLYTSVVRVANDLIFYSFVNGGSCVGQQEGIYTLIIVPKTY